MNFRLRAITAVVSALAVHLTLAPAVSAQGSATFTFNWPAGLQGQVRATGEVTFETMGASQTENSEFAFEVVTAAHPEGLLISNRNFDFGSAGPSGPEEAFVQRMQGTRPELIVSEAGQFVRLNRLGEVQAILSAALDSLPPATVDGMGALFGEMDDDFWISQASTDWNTRVGLWVGRDFRLGEPVTVEGMQRFPMFGSESLPVVWELEYRGSVACNADDSGESCVTLVVETSPDREALAEAMRGFMADLLGDVPAGMNIPFEVDEVLVQSEMVMVVEPRTLLPHSVTMSMTSFSSLSMMGQAQTSRQETREVMTYDWNR